VTLLVVLPVFAVLAGLVLVETGGVLTRRPRLDETARAEPAPRFRTRRSRSVVRPGTTFSVAISGRAGPIGRLLQWSGLVALPELVWALLRRIRYAGGVPGRSSRTSAAAPSPDEAQVDAGQLTR
jgi:hypothetical protein